MYLIVVFGCLILVLTTAKERDDDRNRPKPPLELPVPGSLTTLDDEYSAILNVVNDGPTIYGSQTVFSVDLQSELKGLIAFQWGTYVPYKWKSMYSNNTRNGLVVDWWWSVGSRTCHFIVNQMDHMSVWHTVAKNQSTVQVTDKLKVKLTANQNNKTIQNMKIFLGMCEFKAEIHDPSGYLCGTEVAYNWKVDDVDVVRKITQSKTVKHNFTKEGNFLVQVSVSVTKNEIVYSGQSSIYVEAKAKLTGYVTAWQTEDQHPLQSSPEEPFLLGLVHFQFTLVDTYKVFSAADFSYSWNMGDGKVLEGGSNATGNFTEPRRVQVALSVHANVDARKYHGIIYKNITVTNELKVILSVNQNSKTIENRNIFLGMCELKATINELSHYLRGAKNEYYWILNDVKVVKEKTLINHVKHNFTKEGNFLVEVSASVTKNGMVYIGHGSIHVETKGKLTGYITAWQTEDHHPLLSSSEETFLLGIVHFQFKLVDTYKVFSAADFSYSWNMGDGKVVKGGSNATGNFKIPGLVQVALTVDANANEKRYHAVIYKDIQVTNEVKVVLSVSQNNKTIESRDILLGMCEFKATVKDHSRYLLGGKAEYNWIFNDVKVVKEKTLSNYVKHNFTQEGTFSVEVSVSVTKNGIVYIGHGSIDVETKAKLTGYITAWQNNNHHGLPPPSKQQLKLGLVHFQFVLVDLYKVFAAADFSYSWNMDGKVLEGAPNVTVNFTTPRLVHVALKVDANVNGRKYHVVVYKNVTITTSLKGYINAWNSENHHPTLPSTEISFPLGIVNFQFVLVDSFGVFVSTNLSYSWDFGDGRTFNGSSNTMHNYTSEARRTVAAYVYGNAYGNEYRAFIYKNISIREPIEDLFVKENSKPTKGNVVLFNITCKGSSPVSFCWYVARGDCKLPNDTICSPTNMYDHCQRTINHTFQDFGDYCVNVTVTNTVSSAQTSLMVKISETERHAKSQKHLTPTAVTFIIIFSLVFGILMYLGIKRTIKYRYSRFTEEATFDFRTSQLNLSMRSVPRRNRSYFPKFWRIISNCLQFFSRNQHIEKEHEMHERMKCFDDDDRPSTPHRKITYYGTLQRTSGQNQFKNLNFDIQEVDDFSLWSPGLNMSKSV